MRCAFVHPDLGLGGAERLVLDQALAMKKLGHSVEIYTAHHDPGHAFDDCRQFKVHVHGDQFLPRDIFGFFTVLCAWIRMLYVSLRLIINRNGKYDVIFVDQVSIVLPFLRLASRKLIFYCHFPDQLLALHNTTLRRIYRYPFDWLEEFTMFRYASLILVNSEFTKSVLKNLFKSKLKKTDDCDRITVLYPCVKLPQLMSGQNDNNYNDEKINFLSINRFERKKNVGLAIEAFAKLRELCPDKVERLTLTIAGGCDSLVAENTKHLEELLHLSRSLNVIPEFVLSFSDSQKEAMLKKCTCVVYTPLNEHFGIVPLDAMAYAKPVIALNSGGPRETVVDDVTGFLCSEQNCSELARLMKRFVDDQSLAASMGRSGRKRVETVFSFDRFTDEMESIVSRQNEESM